MAVVALFAFAALKERNPEVKYDASDGLSMAKGYFNEMNKEGYSNEYTKALLATGQSPMEFYAKKTGYNDILAVVMMVSFKPQTVSTTIKDVQDRMGVHKSRLTTNTFLIFPQGVECFANEVGDDKPHAGHMDFKISQSVITGSLTPFFDLPDNTRLNANSYFTLIQANGRVRVYSKKLPDSLDAACRRMIPYILF